MAGMSDISKEIQNSIKNLPDYNYMLGRSLMQPFKPTNSGSRALMNSVHVEHLMVQNHAEVPIIQTGYETEFGRNSSSYVTADSDYEVVAKVQKFEFKDDHYYLITRDLKTGEYDVIERLAYKHNTESYGYLWNNDKLDKMHPGTIINEGDVIKTSIGFDEYGNKMNGVNLVTMYLSCAQNMEDSIIISQTAADKMETSLIKKTSININDNDVLLNLYGDEHNYKTFPDIGEEIKDGIFCSIRRMENDTMLFTMSQKNLRDIMISDRNILMNGKVADISVYANNPEALGDNHYNRQLYYYYQQMLRFSQEIVDIVAPVAMNGKMTRKLHELYSLCRGIVGGKQFFNEKQFSGVVMEITIIEKLPMEPGDKMCDRYGGKGVVSQILPDDQMPLLDNGVRVEVIKNQSTCINRENVGQLNELSLSFIQMRIIDYWKMGVLTPQEMVQMWYDYVKFIDKDLANFIFTAIDVYDEEQCAAFLDSIFEDNDSIIVSTQPYTSGINLDTIAEIYKAFPWIKQYSILTPMEDSNGNTRYVKTRRPMVVGKIYNYRLKQYAEEKFSVTSLSATNLKNLNTRSKGNKVYENRFTKTPIMFGPMESGDLAHIGMQYVVMNLMLYSSSPGARRLFEQLLTGDPYNIDIKLDSESKNRNAEIINALLQTMGLELEFEKIPKQPKMMCGLVMCKTVPPRKFEPKLNLPILNKMNTLEMQYQAALQDRGGKMMCGLVMCKYVDEKKRGDKNGDNADGIIDAEFKDAE